MLKVLKNIIKLMGSLLCILAAVAIMVSDIYNINLNKSMLVALILSVILGSVPFWHNTGVNKQ